MRRLYEAADRFEAQRLIDLLQDHRIPAVMLGDYLSGGAGELPANIFPCVWVVKDTHWYKAKTVLEEFLSSQPGLETEWRCPECGETVEGWFDVCWNCGIPRHSE
jgi:hypothetical protein